MSFKVIYFGVSRKKADEVLYITVYNKCGLISKHAEDKNRFFGPPTVV